MPLRHVMVLMSAIGACAALLMSLEFYQRLKEADRLLSIQNLTPSVDSILQSGMGHVIGLMTLGAIFLALLLVMVVALKDPKTVAILEGQSQPTEPEPITTSEPTTIQAETVSPIQTPAETGSTSEPTTEDASAAASENRLDNPTSQPETHPSDTDIGTVVHTPDSESQ